MNQLAIVQRDALVVSLTKASAELARVETMPEAKRIADIAAAAEIYAKRQGLSQEVISQAHAINIEALAKLGMMLKETPRATGAAGIGPIAVPNEYRNESIPTLSELGIDKKTSAVAQKLAELPLEQFEAVRDGLTTVSRAVASVVRERNAELKLVSKQSLPANKYECIVIDPPWQMDKIERDVRPNQVAFDYPTMDELELTDFDVQSISAEDCHLFCWTTHKHLPMALRLLEAWDFRYVCTMVWHKAGGFQPIGLPQYNCEFVLYARRGSPKFIDTKAFNCCFEAPRREHSRKPDEFYDVIRRVTEGPRIDVFSRELRDGFDQFGNEPERFAA